MTPSGGVLVATGMLSDDCACQNLESRAGSISQPLQFVQPQAEELHDGPAAPPHEDDLQQRASEWVDKVLSPAINAQVTI